MRTIPPNAVITSAATAGETFSAIMRPESSATNSGAVYCNVTACPIGIRASAEKYKIIAVKPTAQRRNIVLGSFIFNEIPRLAAKTATANAITAERTRITTQTSTPSSPLVYFTRAFIVPKQILPKIIHNTAALGESAPISDSFSDSTNELRSGPSPLASAISARLRPSPRLANQSSPQRASSTLATSW